MLNHINRTFVYSTYREKATPPLPIDFSSLIKNQIFRNSKSELLPGIIFNNCDQYKIVNRKQKYTRTFILTISSRPTSNRQRVVVVAFAPE